MSMKNKITNKILNSSNSYNHYKSESELLSNNLSNEMNDLKKEFENYRKHNDEIIESYNNLFNNIFLDFELKPKGVLKFTQELCLELLDFYVNVCEKYNLEYWIDYGNLLGAVRHGGFIPWDDDLDVGMMRLDSIKFNQIIEKEIKINNLEDIIDISFVRRINERNTWSFTQISIRDYNKLYAGLDVFPCDYIVRKPDNLERKFKDAKKEYFKNMYYEMDKNEVIDIYYNSLNCSYEKQNYFLPSIEGPVGRKTYPVRIFKTDKLFPLKEIEYEGKYYSCPNNPHYYVSKIYGEDYMKIPPVVKYHQRLKILKKEDNIKEKYNVLTSRLRKINEEFI